MFVFYLVIFISLFLNFIADWAFSDAVHIVKCVELFISKVSVLYWLCVSGDNEITGYKFSAALQTGHCNGFIFGVICKTVECECDVEYIISIIHKYKLAQGVHKILLMIPASSLPIYEISDLFFHSDFFKD